MPARAGHAVVALLLAVASGSLACGAGEPDPASDTASPDTAVDTEGAEVDVAPVEPELVLGTNITGQNTPATFTPLAPGDALAIEFGPQGLWMVVLAFKTRGMLETRGLFLSAEILVGAASQGKLQLEGQRTNVGGDGWEYYYNFFLVVDDPTVAGAMATIDFYARDGAGVEHEQQLEVLLTGGL